MPPKRTSKSEAPAMTQAAIKKLVADSVSAALEAQAANMANTDNTTRPKEALVATKCSYKEFMRCQPINFKGTEGAIGLIRWFERTESVFSRSNCTKNCKVKFATSTLTEEALSWWNSFAQPIGIEEAYKITWVRIYQKSQENHQKTSKHGHENGRVYKSRKPKPEKVKSTVNSSQSWSTKVKNVGGEI
ncbi:hypothetical protein Tco_1085774 [Tanacetum coccineum]